MRRRLRTFFRGVAEPVQLQFMDEVEDAFRSGAQVVVGSAPVAFGKTLIEDAVARWAMAKSGLGCHGAIVCHPNNALVAQYHAACPAFAVLHRKDSYRCVSGQDLSCVDRAQEMGSYCRSHGPRQKWDPQLCPYLQDLRTAQGGGSPLTSNYHIYLAHKLMNSRDFFIADEAHLVPAIIAGARATSLWRPVHGWTTPMYDAEDVRRWLTDDVPRADIDNSRALQMAWEVLVEGRPGYTVTCDTASYRNREDVERVLITPLDVRTLAQMWFPGGGSQRLLLLSATISKYEVADMGLDSRVVHYLRGGSRIPEDRRPLVYVPIANMTASVRARNLHAVRKFIEEISGPTGPHRGEKGLVHMPYKLAAEFRELVDGDPRYLFHGHTDKGAVLRKWYETAPDSDVGTILVGSGMYEGLNLIGDLARWQVLAVTPRPSLGDPANRHMYRYDRERYNWLTVRDMVQGYGRVCRGPTDKGTTYIVDTSAPQVLKSDMFRELLPLEVSGL
jgi:hypothetical protein